VNTVSIVGVGLIGGSFALALRKAGFRGRIIGVSSKGTVRKALDMRIIDEALPLKEAGPVSDLVYLSQPIRRILQTLGELDAFVRPGAVITDAGSTKAVIGACAARNIRQGRFIGGHPMAGKESRGVEGADPDLFAGRPYVLTDRDPALESWIERIGARLVFLDAAEHDRLVAITSHLPQLASVALAAMIGECNAGQVAGPGAVDMTRLALSSYEIWRDILDTNTASIDAALSSYIARLEQMRTKVRGSGLASEFAHATAAARALRQK
jgi:prephenate dehydrogenase